MNPGLLGKLFIEDDAFLDLRGASLGITYLVLHVLVLLEVFVEFSLELSEVALKLFGRSMDGLHCLEGNASQRAAVGRLINVMV